LLDGAKRLAERRWRLDRAFRDLFHEVAHALFDLVGRGLRPVLLRSSRALSTVNGFGLK